MADGDHMTWTSPVPHTPVVEHVVPDWQALCLKAERNLAAADERILDLLADNHELAARIEREFLDDQRDD